MTEPAETRDPRLTFGTVVDMYDEIRPTYPQALFDALFALLPPEPEVVEVGPGTGQATRDLLARGARRPRHRDQSIDGQPAAREPSDGAPRGERRRLRDDRHRRPERRRVFASSAYHWISPAAQLDRPALILRPGGVLAIVGLFQVDSPEDQGFYAAAQPIYERYGRADEGPPAEARTDVEPTIAQALAADPRFTDVEVHRWDWDQTYTAAGYRKLMLSFSDTNMMDASDRMGLVDDMEAFINRPFRRTGHEAASWSP